MKKISLVTLENQKLHTLSKLRKLGTVHIEACEGSGEKLQQINSSINLIESALFKLGKVKSSLYRDIPPSEALIIARNICDISEEQNKLLEEKRRLEAKSEVLERWSNINPTALSELCSKGIEISLYEMPVSEYEALGDDVETLCIEKSRSFVKFLCIGKAEAIENYRAALPEFSQEELSARLSQLAEREKENEAKLHSYTEYTQSLKAALKVLEKEKEFEQCSSAMEKHDISSPGSPEVSLAHLTGYIEEARLPDLKEAAKENSWGLLIEDPEPGDNVPTKLKNNKFVSLIYPLTDFLGTVPGYFEYDISGWFLAFILIFFGIIFGDGGYGLLICAVCAVPIIKAMIAGKPVQPTFLLIGLFGLATVLWGTLTCTWFGLDALSLPVWLRKLSVPVISNAYANKLWYPFSSVNAGLTTS
ncbi:MAG: hypothetical protein IKM51_01250, partial [Oscillospiraceae bacterium]|nr:hypothetical protein [Oscillospiraceae bacterium]